MDTNTALTSAAYSLYRIEKLIQSYRDLPTMSIINGQIKGKAKPHKVEMKIIKKNNI